MDLQSSKGKEERVENCLRIAGPRTKKPEVCPVPQKRTGEKELPIRLEEKEVRHLAREATQQSEKMR